MNSGVSFIYKEERMTRRNARELVMQMLYEGTFHQEQERERILYDNLKKISGTEKNSNKAVMRFIEEVYFGILEHLEEIDALIQEMAANWSLNRIAKVDLSILRLAIYEIKYTDVPNKVAANEAVEIAKAYSTDKSPKFINGILGSVIKSIEA